ncbi:MAG TPA: serine hydrolase [Cellulomonas sp.]
MDRGAETLFERVYGLADRAHGAAVTTAHRFAVASISRGFAAPVIGSLVDEGALGFDDRVRGQLGPDRRAHLPVPAAGDGGALSTAGDLALLWPVLREP